MTATSSKEGRNKTLCEICNKCFSSNNSLKVHLKTIHQNLKAYDCTICKKAFGQKGHLNSHIKEIHEERNKSCSNVKSVKPSLETVPLLLITSIKFMKAKASSNVICVNILRIFIAICKGTLKVFMKSWNLLNVKFVKKRLDKRVILIVTKSEFTIVINHLIVLKKNSTFNWKSYCNFIHICSSKLPNKITIKLYLLTSFFCLRCFFVVLLPPGPIDYVEYVIQGLQEGYVWQNNQHNIHLVFRCRG